VRERRSGVSQTELKCPDCGQRSSVPEAVAGKSVTCPVCGSDMAVPGLSPGAAQTEPESQGQEDDLKRRSGAKWRFVGRLLFVCVVGLALERIVYFREAATFLYALQHIKTAVKEHDLSKFEKYVDVETLVSGLIDDLLAESVEQAQAESSAEAAGTAFGAGVVLAMKPRLVEEANRQITRFVQEGRFREQETGADVRLDVMFEDFGTVEENFTGGSYAQSDGKIAIVGWSFRDKKRDRETMLELKFRKVGRHWRLVKLSNARRLMREHCEREAERRVAEARRVAQLNTQTREKMSRILRAEGYKGWAAHGLVMGIRGTVTNISDETVTEFSALARVLGPEGGRPWEGRFRSSSAIPPGDCSGFLLDVDSSEPSGAMVYATPHEQVRVEVEFEKIVLGDGTVLELVGAAE